MEEQIIAAFIYFYTEKGLAQWDNEKLMSEKL